MVAFGDRSECRRVGTSRRLEPSISEEFDLKKGDLLHCYVFCPVKGTLETLRLEVVTVEGPRVEMRCGEQVFTPEMLMDNPYIDTDLGRLRRRAESVMKREIRAAEKHLLHTKMVCARVLRRFDSAVA